MWLIYLLTILDSLGGLLIVTSMLLFVMYTILSVKYWMEKFHDFLEDEQMKVLKKIKKKIWHSFLYYFTTINIYTFQ